MPMNNLSFNIKQEPICTHCGLPLERTPHHDYMLTDAVWAQVHPEGGRGFLHDQCLVQRAASLGAVLDESAFTDCLCYVNRHIHRATPRLLMEKFLYRHELELSRAPRRGRAPMHFAVFTSMLLERIGSQDRAMARNDCRPSSFLHLFRTDPATMGSNFPLQLPGSAPSASGRSSRLAERGGQ